MQLQLNPQFRRGERNRGGLVKHGVGKARRIPVARLERSLQQHDRDVERNRARTAREVDTPRPIASRRVCFNRICMRAIADDVGIVQRAHARLNARGKFPEQEEVLHFPQAMGGRRHSLTPGGTPRCNENFLESDNVLSGPESDLN